MKFWTDKWSQDFTYCTQPFFRDLHFYMMQYATYSSLHIISVQTCNRAFVQTITANINHILPQQEKYKDKWSTDLDSCMSKKEWKCINSLPFKITQDTTLRWLQYRIIHRCIATNELLHKINILDSNLCTFCGEHVENILHLFCKCKHVNSF